MTKLLKEIGLYIATWILILLWNYYNLDNASTFIAFLFCAPLVLRLMKLSNGVRLNKPYKEHLIYVCVILFIIVSTYVSKGFNNSILNIELSLLKTKREKVIRDIKFGQYSAREDGVKAFEVMPHFPRISWFGKNDVLLDNLNKDSFRIRFFLPKSKTDMISLVYSEDKIFNERVLTLVKQFPKEHRQLEKNWFLTSYLPGLSNYKVE